MSTLNTTVGILEGSERRPIQCVCLSPGHVNQCSTGHWRSWSLLLLHGLSKHVQGAIFVNHNVIGEKASQIAADFGVGSFVGSDGCLLPVISVS